MQLFITNNFKILNKKIIINDERIRKQLCKVLRAKKGYKFFIQHKTFNNIQKRYLCEIEQIKDNVYSKIIKTQEKKINNFNYGIITAILNKYDKMELIIQKLSELAIPKIAFVPTERSIFKKIPYKKIERFKKISLEAVEQSFGWFLPEIIIFNNLKKIPGKKAILNLNGDNINLMKIDTSINWLIIGPEGGLTTNDIKEISPKQIIKLGESILRAETASIIGGYEFKKNLFKL